MLIYGHRGARGEAPENTLAGFRHALASGVERVELDLHLSHDGELVVIHDETLERTTDGRGKVARHDAAALWALDARRSGPGWPEPQGVPTLERVLQACPGIRHFQLECKSTGPKGRARVAEKLAELFSRPGFAARATVTSFDAALLEAVRRQAPAIPLGYVTDRARPDPVRTALGLGAGMLALWWKLATARRVEAAHAAGLHVSVWTVNDEPTALALRERGVDSLITDFPSRFAPLGR